MADVSVRPARPEDAERIARVQLATWRQAYEGLLPPETLDTPEVQLAAVWLNAIETRAPRSRVLVAMDRAELVGFLASAPSLDEDAGLEVSALLVEPRWGRRGHGSRLVAAAVEHWRGDAETSAVLWTWEDEPALSAFLAEAGWARDGRARILDVGPRLQRQVRWHTDLQEDG